MLDNNSPDDSPARRFDEDDRGVSEIIGTILIFGILIALLVLIQVSAVPAWNQQVEYEHNKRVQEDIQELGSTLTAASADGNDRTTVIEMGVQYPTRPFLFNPAPTGGTLETVPNETEGIPDNATITNANVTGVDYPYETDGTIAAPTRAIRYRPGYNQYGNAPVTVIENGVVYNRYDGAVLPMDDGNIVNGSNINLLVVDGQLRETTSGPRTIRTQVTSGPAQTVSIESDDGGPIYVRVPTLLEESHWDRILAGQPNVTDVTVDANDRLVIELRPGTYNLRMAEVGFGPNVEDEPAAYITDIEGGGETVLTGTTTTLTAEVRDQYNNPVANEEVTVDLENGSGEFIDSDGNSLGSGSYTTQTDTNGEVTVRFRPTGNSTHDVTVTGDFGGKPSADRVRFRIRSAAAVGGGVSSGGVSAINPGAGAEQVRLTGVTTTNGSKNVQLTFNNDAPVELSMTEMRISYYLSDDGTAAANNGTFSYGGDTETLVVYDEFVEVPGPTFASEGSGGSEVQTVAINDLKNNVKGDFMIVSVRYADGADNERTITYFVGIP